MNIDTFDTIISLELLKNPVYTRCSHSFCWECIMRVMKKNQTAHCPLCNKSINRRSITHDEKIGKLVENVQNLIDSIGKDTGFDSKYELVFILFPCFVRKNRHMKLCPCVHLRKKF